MTRRKSGSIRPVEVKTKIISAFLNCIFAKSHDYVREEVVKIIMAQALINGDGVTGFIYKGEKYRIGPKTRVGLLDRSLYSRMDAVLAFQKQLELDTEQTRNYFRYAMNQSDSPADYMLLFPSAIRRLQPALCETFHVPIEGVDFEDIEVPDLYRKAYDTMCSRLLANALME